MAKHPIWRIVDDPARNREILDRMPPFYGTNLTDRLKPAATLLGVSDRPLAGVVAPALPRGKSRPGGPGSAPTGTPIFSAQPYGRGRSFAMSTDSTTSWGSAFESSWGEGDNRHFRKFWRNVVTWLAENSSGSSRQLEVATDRVVYRPGRPIEVTARAFDEKLEPTDRYRLVARLLAADARLGRRPTARGGLADGPCGPVSGDFAASLPIPPGRVDPPSRWLQPPGRDGRGGRLRRRPSRHPGEPRRPDPRRLRRVPRPPARRRSPRPARQALSGGSVLTGADDLARHLEQSTERVDRVVTTRSPLWDSPAVMGLVMALLVAEWAIRRWKGLA